MLSLPCWQGVYTGSAVDETRVQSHKNCISQAGETELWLDSALLLSVPWSMTACPARRPDLLSDDAVVARDLATAAQIQHEAVHLASSRLATMPDAEVLAR